MKKSLIALAVAGTFAAPAFAATSNVDIYGAVRASVDYTDSKAVNRDRWTVSDQTSRIGVKGSEDLGGGMKAVWQWESQLNNIDNAGAVNTTQRNTFVGLAGGFGTVLVGTHDTPYKLGGSADVFADTAADSQRNGTGIIGRNNFDNRAAGTVAYVSPDFSGFHFAAAVIPGEQAGGTPASNAANGLMDAYSLVAVYANGPLKATLGYENFDGENANVAGIADRNATKFNIAYKVGDIGLGYTYERSKDFGTAAGVPNVPAGAINAVTTRDTDTAHLASVTYGMGPITLAGQYGKFTDKVGTNAVGQNLTRWTVGAIYGLSKRTNVYAAYNADDYSNETTTTYATANRDATTWTFGLNHAF